MATLTEQAATAIVEPYGFVARAVPLGFFLEPLERDRFGHRRQGESHVLVKHSGEIIPYSDRYDAQTHLAATALTASLPAGM